MHSEADSNRNWRRQPIPVRASLRLFSLLTTESAPLSLSFFFLELTHGTVSAEHGVEALWDKMRREPKPSPFGGSAC